MLRSNEPLLLLKEDKPINLKDLGFRFDICQEIWGKWSKGFHGDCYLENDFERNPQIDIFVPESDIVLKQTVRFKVLKDWNAEDASLGFRLFRIGPDDEVPKPSYWLFHNWENSVRCRDGSIEGWEWDYLAPTFTLEPGRYCGILYNETRGGSDTAFCIMVMSAVPLEITIGGVRSLVLNIMEDIEKLRKKYNDKWNSCLHLHRISKRKYVRYTRIQQL